jgi:hypothetical protein
VSQDTRLKDPNSFPTATLGELKAQATFANPSLSDEANYVTFTPNRVFEFLLKSGEFVCSASEGT